MHPQSGGADPGRGAESAHRLFSLHDVDVRQIRKGRGKPVELGYKAQVIDNADSVILDHTIGIRHPMYASQSQRRSNASPAALEALDGQ